jgi:hypothetical protein
MGNLTFPDGKEIGIGSAMANGIALFQNATAFKAFFGFAPPYDPTKDLKYWVDLLKNRYDDGSGSPFSGAIYNIVHREAIKVNGTLVYGDPVIRQALITHDIAGTCNIPPDNAEGAGDTRAAAAVFQFPIYPEILEYQLLADASPFGIRIVPPDPALKAQWDAAIGIAA